VRFAIAALALSVVLFVGFAVLACAEGSDFVPGEKQVFYDDFTDMAKGSSPPHWAVRGAAAKLVAVGNAPGLQFTGDTTLIANLKTLPRNFTIGRSRGF